MPDTIYFAYISDECSLSIPCSHNITFFYKDGKINTELIIMNKKTYNIFREFFSEYDREKLDKHFEY